jgi:glyoxylase-like metal-dependent hydrolase (beta-lactamase superfamily II)
MIESTPQRDKKIRIRMYRLGIGDCFLLTFYHTEKACHILIDCGVLTGTPQGKEKIQKVAENIAEETEGHLHALVATHEHWDHISGFFEAEDIFERISVDEIWLAWTENPNDPQARELKR